MNASAPSRRTAIGDRPVDALPTNTGHGIDQSFLDLDFEAVQHVVSTNTVGKLRLAYRVCHGMRARNSAKFMIGGSIAGLIPGATDTHYFEGADLMATKVGAYEKKDAAAEVAKQAFDTMQNGDSTARWRTWRRQDVSRRDFPFSSDSSDAQRLG